MPPNLGGFFMVRSYYPSECHADYFDFERIEALKPAIEACGISTLSQIGRASCRERVEILRVGLSVEQENAGVLVQLAVCCGQCALVTVASVGEVCVCSGVGAGCVRE